MKKTFILVPIVGAMLYLGLSSYATGPAATGGLERTGASGGTIGCGGLSCHSTGATASTTLTVQLFSGSTPVTSYNGGTAYTIRITGTQTSGSLILPEFGFQLAVMKTGSTTANEGTLSAIAGTHIATASGITIVEHSAPITSTTGTGGSGTTYVVNIPWTAPVAGTGSVTIFSTLNSVNGNTGADAGDKWNNTSLAVPEATVATVAPITGTLSVCVGSTTPLADATASGTWSSSLPGTATVSATGVVTGVAAGTAVISYTVGTASATATVTVNPLPATILGTMSTCTGGTTNLTDATTGGTWSSSATATATVSGTGVVSGVTAGTATITYALPTGCKETATVTITATTPITVTGTDTVCTSHTIDLADATAGGTWSSGTATVATVGTSGIVTGVANGTSVISYSLPGGCIATKAIVVESVPGTISGHDTVCVGSAITLTESLTGGTWSTTNTHASVGSATGVVAGLTTGTDTIKYIVTNLCGTGTATHTVLVRAAGLCASAGVNAVGATVNELKVYPNPAREGNFTVNLSSDIDEEAHIVITNILGAVVKELTAHTNDNLDVQLGHTTGIYILTAITEHGKYVTKVVLQ